tara:strand:+ start:1641 stop:2405 length:765 start_codon:yes stop_codon:yes gene_type:complete
MSIITFISDFGLSDHYVSSVKASILKYNSSNQIIDISHEINKYDLSHAAHVFKNVFEEFPQGSIHIIAVKNYESADDLLLFQINNQYIITYDSGIISLINSSENINATLIDESSNKVFPEKYMGEIASKLASGINYTTLGKPYVKFKKFLDREVSLSKGKIVGYTMRIDSYGNIITNISKSDFISSLNKSSGSFSINLGIDKITKISDSYSDVGVADLFALFNYNGFLEIGMNGGGASELLGIKNHTPISIIFL